MAVNLNNTTTAGAISKTALSVIMTALPSNMAKGFIMVVDEEAFLINDFNTDTKQVNFQRGWAGTRGDVEHASGQVAWLDKPELFYQNQPTGKATAANEKASPRIVLPAANPNMLGAEAWRIVNDSWVKIDPRRVKNHRCFDPDTGYEYLLVGCAADLVDGEFVVVDPDGAASALATTSKGRVAIMVEAVTGSSTALSWALVVGKYANALTTSTVTTAADLIAGTGCANILSSDGGNIIWGAACTVAPSTTTSPSIGDGLATVYVSNPWVSGEIHSFSSVGT